MALDHLLAALERDATAAAERLLAEARAEAERLKAEATATADHRRDAEVAGVRRARRERLEEELGATRRAARREVLAARERLVDRLDSALRRALPTAIGGPGYVATVAERIGAGLACLPEDERVTVRAPSALVPAIRKGWPAGRDVGVVPDEGIGSGFRLASADGTIEVDGTLEASYAARRGVLVREALASLGEAP